MATNDFVLWSTLAVLCSFALFVEAALLFRAILFTHEAWWRYLVVVPPLGVSIWSFIVIQKAWLVSNALLLSFPPHIHFNLAEYRSWIAPLAQATLRCQLQMGITIVVFLAMLYIEKKLFPHERYIK